MAVMPTSRSRRIGRYELLSYVGSGGMSDVYVALHTGLRKRVALKLLRASLRCDTQAVQRFLREGECAARVRHPNVVDVSDVGSDNGVPYLVMELLDGETLQQTLQRSGPLSLARAVDLFLPIFDAVSAVHAAGVLHRDIKPANILLARAADGSVTPKLVDFGIAQLPGHEKREAERVQGPLGTPHYMSPEQARGEAVDEHSDQYALASVLFEALVGREPYEGKTVEAVMREVSRGRFPRVRKFLPELPEAFEEVLARASSRQPAQRFASVSAFAHALVPFASARTRKLYVAREARAGIYSAQLLSGNFRTEPPACEPVQVAASFAPRRATRFNQYSLRALGGAALLGMGLLAGLGVTHGLAEAERTSNALAGAAPGTPAAHETEAPLAPPLSRTVRLVPSEAVAQLDGNELGRGDIVLPQLDDGVHELRVSAPGHVARVMLFRNALAESTIVLDPRKR